MLQNCAQSNCRIIPKKLRDMKREEICRLLADKVNKLKNKEKSLSELLPDVRLLYGETPFARTPVMYEPGKNEAGSRPFSKNSVANMTK